MQIVSGNEEVVVQKIFVCFIVVFGFLWGSTTHAQDLVTPDWDSDRILANRAQSDDNAIVIIFRSETKSGDKQPVVKSGTVRLWSDFDQISIGTSEIITDYRLCRVFGWKHSETKFSNQSCYAGPTFRKMELSNRLQIGKIFKQIAKPEADFSGAGEPFWMEQELAVQNTVSNPLAMLESAKYREWKLAGKTVVKTSIAGLPFLSKDRQKFARYFARYLSIHPQIRRAILDSGKIPSQIVATHRNSLGREITEIISFSSIENVRAAYPLPPKMRSDTELRSAGNSAEAKGIRRTLGALYGFAQPPKPSFDEIFSRMEVAAKKKEPLEATLAFLELTQTYGGAIMAERERLERVRSIMPILQPMFESNEAANLMKASNLAGKMGAEPEREASALYLANARGLDEIGFGTFRYVTFANLVRISKGTKKWDEAIFKKMPSLTDSYWTHIAAYPWASNAFKDLGDTWLAQFETFKAWEVWDLGKAIDPDWRRGSMKSVADYEKNIRASMPDSF